MNREIKFKLGYPDNGSIFWQVLTLEEIRQGKCAFGNRKPSIIREYTGIKDRDREEIYEGSKIEYDFSQQSILVDTEVIGVGEVVFVRNYAAFAIKGNDDESFESLNSSTPEQAKEFKVIGNIYEKK